MKKTTTVFQTVLLDRPFIYFIDFFFSLDHHNFRVNFPFFLLKSFNFRHPLRYEGIEKEIEQSFEHIFFTWQIFVIFLYSLISSSVLVHHNSVFILHIPSLGVTFSLSSPFLYCLLFEICQSLFQTSSLGRSFTLNHHTLFFLVYNIIFFFHFRFHFFTLLPLHILFCLISLIFFLPSSSWWCKFRKK